MAKTAMTMRHSKRVKPERRESIETVRSAARRGALEGVTAGATAGTTDRALHAWLRARGPRGGGIELGIGDDCAVVRAGRERWALKVDPTIEGVHFRAGLRDAAAIARKAIGRPVSDCAATGAAPRYALLAVELPRGTSGRFARALLGRLLAAARRHGARVVGGHTGFGAGPLSVTVTLAGPCPRPRSRRGARPGDRLLATGAFGGASLGRHLAPRPRLRESEALARAVPIRAAIDVSDGLALDASRLADAGALALELLEAAIPVSRDARRLSRRTRVPPLSHALSDGEDYECLFVVAARDVAKALAAARRARFPLREIGAFRRGHGLWLRRRDGRLSSIAPTGYLHRA